LSRWNHAICRMCWGLKHGPREPVRVIPPKEETCCYCGESTTASIYTRDDPSKTPYCAHDRAAPVRR